MLTLDSDSSSLRSWLLATACLWLLSGCDSPENDPQPAGQTNSGESLSLSVYASEVNTVFDQPIGPQNQACSDAGCHNINDGKSRFRLVPGVTDPDSTQMLQNFIAASAMAEVERPETSPLLLKPLQGDFPSVGPHEGGDSFDSVNDANYLTIYRWINEPVEGSGSAP